MELKEALGVEIIGPHEADRPLLDNLENQAKRFGIAERCATACPTGSSTEGETVSFGEHVFEVLHCPGHAPGHVVYYNRAAKFAHVGDVLFRGSVGRTDLPGGDHAALIPRSRTSFCRSATTSASSAAMAPAAASARSAGPIRFWSELARRHGFDAVARTKSADLAAALYRSKQHRCFSWRRRNAARRHCR